MAAFKSSFYIKGVDNQKRADIVIDLRRPDRKKIKEWTPEQKQKVSEWLISCESVFKAFKEEILNQ